MKKLVLFIPLAFSFLFSEDTTSRAIITSYDRTIISSEISGNIVYLNKIDGDSFQKNDLLVKLNCDVYKAKKEKAAIEKNIAYLKYKKNKKLESFKSIGKFEVDISKEEYRKEESEYKIASINVTRCDIYAPYNGRIVSRKVSQYQSIKPNEEILEIISTDNLEAKTFVPSTWITWLKKDGIVNLEVDETKSIIKGLIKEIGSVVDPVSQTVLVRISLEKPYEKIIPGMSATAVFEVKSE